MGYFSSFNKWPHKGIKLSEFESFWNIYLVCAWHSTILLTSLYYCNSHCSLLWAADIIWRENLLSISHFWNGYPHVNMTFMFKFFFIVQVMQESSLNYGEAPPAAAAADGWWSFDRCCCSSLSAFFQRLSVTQWRNSRHCLKMINVFFNASIKS